MSTYRVETDKGIYEVETEDTPQEGMQEMAGASANPNVDPREGMKDYPNSLYTDPSVNDFQMVMGAGGLAKAGLKGAGMVAEELAPQLARIGRNQTMKGMGGSMSQIKQMATKGNIDEAARFANEKGLNDVFSTSLGRENLLKILESQTGSKIGQLRNEAGTVLNPKNLEATVMQDPKMTQYLDKGLHSGEASEIPKALNDVNRIAGPNPSYADRAEAATFLNQSANKGKLYQPQNATTDVANILSRENNAGIRASLGPEKAGQYDEVLGDYTNIEPLRHLQDRGELRDIASRGGMSAWGDVKHTVGDAFGHRGMAKAAYVGEDAANSIKGLAKTSVGGVTTHLMRLLTGNPQALGQYAAPLLKAAQTGGNEALAATHYILSTSHPTYNQLFTEASPDKPTEEPESVE